MYNYLLKKINKFLRINYYDNYFKNNKLINVEKNIFKLEYFLYIKFYVIYLFLYNFKIKNSLHYSFLLNFQYVIGEVCMNNIKYYKITPENTIKSINKFFIIMNLFLFHFGIIIHQLFKKRIDCIKNKKVLQDHFDFLFLLHGLEDLNIVLEKTIFMNYSNFYFYLTIIFFMFT